MLILAVDTTSEFGSIALADENGVREEVLLQEPQGFSAVLFQEIGELLKRQSVRLADVDLFAGASGPGGFTGVRIGLAAVKGLGEVLGKPVVAVSNLLALAQYGSAELRATVIDARRGEVFAALYSASGEPVIPEQVVRFPHFVEMLAGYEFEWVSSAVVEGISATVAPPGLAGAIARIAAGSLQTDAAVVEANYVRRSDAELLWKG